MSFQFLSEHSCPVIRFSAPGALCCAHVRPKVTQSEAVFWGTHKIPAAWGFKIYTPLPTPPRLPPRNAKKLVRVIIRGVPGQGGTGLDTYQICIQARFDTYQIPFLI